MRGSEPAPAAVTVGLVVVTYDSAAFVARLVAAIAAQTRRPDRLVFVDNASRDDTRDVLRRALAEARLDARLVALDANTGFAHANNVAVAALDDCAYVALLNPDAFPEPEWLARLADAAARHPEAGSFASRQMRDGAPGILDGAGDVYHVSGVVWRHGHGRPLAEVPGALDEREVFAPCAAAALYRRADWAALGGFDERFFCYVEDVDLGFRLRRRGRACWYVPDAVVSHMGSATSGVGSAFAVYHGHRNVTWTFVKNMPGRLLWRHLPAHVAASVAGVAWFAWRGQLAAYLRAKRDALTGLAPFVRERRAAPPLSAGTVAAIDAQLARGSLMARGRGGGLATLAFNVAWRGKHLARFVVPAALRQRVGRALFRRAYATSPPAAPARAVSTPVTGPFGLNVIGYLRAESGVAEAARATLRACRAAGVPAAAIAYARAAPSRMQEAVPDGFARSPEFGVTLLHLNADQSAYAIADHADALTGKYRIASWNWELPEFPAVWPEAERQLDEVWAPSTFCAEAFRRRLTIPVTHMPYAVDVPVPSGVGREALGLQCDAFVFLFVFDAFSVPARKNPLAVVEAYTRLRAAVRRPTQLVLKVINAASDAALARDLQQAAAADPSLVLIDRYLARPELNALLQAADAYVSLHRSEGFGFTIAEAMALGKPVVATGWSGNMDFMTPGNSCPVDYTLVTLETDHGPYTRGQRWADPDVAHAAAQMTRLITDAGMAATLGAQAAHDIRAQLSPLAVGRRIEARLRALRG